MNVEWFNAYAKDVEPTWAQIEAYIDNPLWHMFNDYLQAAYAANPKLAYSGCSGQPGWNIKYQKGGRSLCTLYPMPGYFIALVTIGERERVEAELLLPGLSQSIQMLYANAVGMMGAKWLMIEVKEEQTERDVRRLIALRRQPSSRIASPGAV